MKHLILAAGSSLALTFAAPAMADTLVDNVDGVTIDATGGMDRFTGLVIGDDGRIKQVLRRGDKRPERPDFKVDGKGRVMLPGMIDSHGHVMSLGFAALTLDLSAAKSLPEALAMVGDYAKAHPERPWIIGRGWNQELWPEKRFPTAAELDAVVPDRPVWLGRVDGHAAEIGDQPAGAVGTRRGSTCERIARRSARFVGESCGCYAVNWSGNWAITPALSMSAISNMCASATP